MKGRTIKNMLLSAITMAAVLAVPFQSMASVDEVISGGTANFDFVFAVSEDETIDYSSEAESSEEDNAVFFLEEDTTEVSFYMGMGDAMFDRVYFELDDAIVLDDEDDEVVWEYYDGSDWEELDVDPSKSGGLTTVDTRYVDLEIPSDWEKTTVEDEEGYFVRLTPSSDVEEGGEVEQISARAYTVDVRLKNDNGDELDDLEDNDFQAENGSDDNIYGVLNMGDGRYLIAIQTEGDDTEYTLEVNAEKYNSRGINVEGDTMDVPVYSRTLTYRPAWIPEDEREYCPTPFIDIDNHWVQSTIRELYCKGVFEDTYYFKPNVSMKRAEFIKLLLEISDVEIGNYDEDDEEYRDVEEGDWYFDYVMTAYDLDIVDDATYFNPEDSMSRAEATAMAIRLAAELKDVNMDDSDTRFSDVSRNDWYAEYVKTAFNYQIIVGYQDGTFRGDNNVTRAEGATIVNNFWYAFVREVSELND